MTVEFLAFAHTLADAAGAAIRPYFGAHGDVEEKSDNSPVTLADKIAEKAMRALIDRTYPDHAIYGEEGGQKKTISEYCWVIDPIDGTRAFIAARKEWGTLIALCADGVPILGILDQPITGERWVGVKGESTTHTVTPHLLRGPSSFEKDGAGVTTLCQARPCTSLADAEFSTTSALYFTPTQAKHIATLAGSCRRTVKDGDCYAYGLLARGARDLVVDAGLKPYDILALVPIIEGAGGVITGWDGSAVTLSNYANVVAAGDAALHKETLALLQENR